jgi:hypothetical protein
VFIELCSAFVVVSVLCIQVYVVNVIESLDFSYDAIIRKKPCLGCCIAARFITGGLQAVA